MKHKVDNTYWKKVDFSHDITLARTKFSSEFPVVIKVYVLHYIPITTTYISVLYSVCLQVLCFSYWTPVSAGMEVHTTSVLLVIPIL